MEHIEPPQEFLELAKQFHQDAFLINANEGDVISKFMNNLDSQRENILLQFIETLVGSSIEDKQLQELWNNSGSDYYFRSGADVREFLRFIIQRRARMD